MWTGIEDEPDDEPDEMLSGGPSYFALLASSECTATIEHNLRLDWDEW